MIVAAVGAGGLRTTTSKPLPPGEGIIDKLIRESRTPAASASDRTCGFPPGWTLSGFAPARYAVTE
ncbi:MAG: hypothetical protein ACNS63_09290 [Candidatus Nitrospinota bacterium M3_3B_026]